MNLILNSARDLLSNRFAGIRAVRIKNLVLFVQQLNQCLAVVHRGIRYFIIDDEFALRIRLDRIPVPIMPFFVIFRPMSISILLTQLMDVLRFLPFFRYGAFLNLLVFLKVVPLPGRIKHDFGSYPFFIFSPFHITTFHFNISINRACATLGCNKT